MTETLIIGSGLSGLLVAQNLVDLGWTSIRVLESGDPLTASNAPLAICHPFPGRTLKPSPLLAKAYEETQRWMVRWESWEARLVDRLEMRRLLDAAGGERLLNSFHEHWNEAQPPWGEIRLSSDEKTLRYSPCYAVRLGPLRELWKKRLQRAGVGFDNTPPSSAWTGPLILCPGRGLSKWFPHLPLTNEGGELATFASTTRLDTLISGGGVHLCPNTERSVVAGSTRWVAEMAPAPTAHLSKLQDKVARCWPHVLDVESVWQGVRSIYSGDRLPLAGPVPSRHRTWVVGALGSKGLLWGPLAARTVALNLTEGTPVPSDLSTGRLPAQTWELQWPESPS